MDNLAKTAFIAIAALLASALFLPPFEAQAREWKSGEALIICFHDIPASISGNDPYAMELTPFARQVEFLRDKGCNFISGQDLLDALAGRKELPPKAVLLTFDDAYESFYKNVFPLLKRYKIPSVIGVVSSWLDKAPDEGEYRKEDGFLSWEQLKELSASGLVEVASHSYAQHTGVQSNPQGNTSPAYAMRSWNPATKTYETESEYRQRIASDMAASVQSLEKACGKKPKILVWPYGRYSGIALEEAKKAGFETTLTLDPGIVDTKIKGQAALPRHMVMYNQTIEDFAADYNRLFIPINNPFRALQTDLDLIYDADPAEQERNLDKFLDRMVEIHPGIVLLQAYADDPGDGNIRSVYFPNSVLPMKTDLFSRVAQCLQSRGILVYAWMPTLAIVLPDAKLNESLRVREFKDGVIRPTSSWYTNRLSPFSETALERISTLYRDMAACAMVDGVIFQDDCYLTDFEDFHPDAIAAAEKAGIPLSKGKARLSQKQVDAWTALKTERLIEATMRFKKAVEVYRPSVKYARTVYAPIILEPGSEEWLAQSYSRCLESYDFTVAMCYPRMEKVFFSEHWLKSLVRKTRDIGGDATAKTVFKLQAYDWSAKKWIGSAQLCRWLKTVEGAGGANVAYYPDDFTVDEPRAKSVKQYISVKDAPEPGR